MGGHRLGEFEFAAVLEVIGDAGGAKTVIASQSADASLLGEAVRSESSAGLSLSWEGAISFWESYFGVSFI